jgi:hypothetical protein
MAAALHAVEFFGASTAFTRLVVGTTAVMVAAGIFVAIDRSVRDGVRRLMAKRRDVAEAGA